MFYYLKSRFFYRELANLVHVLPEILLISHEKILIFVVIYKLRPITIKAFSKVFISLVTFLNDLFIFTIFHISLI